MMRIPLRSLLLVASLVPCVAAAHPAVSVVRDSRGNVYYSDLTHVWRIAPDGRKSIAVPNVHTHELFLDSRDYLYGEHLWYEGEASDKWGHRVWQRAPDGSITTVIPRTEGFLTGYSFVRDRAGTMYWAEREGPDHIRKKRKDGRIEIHSRGPFNDIRWMISDAAGNLYLIDAGDLKKVLPDGSVRPLAKGLATRSVTRFTVGAHHAVMGLWLDGRNNVYAAIYGSGAVKRIAPDGRVTTVARSRLPWSPTGGMIGPDGSLWILEASVTNAVRMRRVPPDGRARIY